MVVKTAKQVDGGLPFGLELQMYFWVFLDLVIGLVPFAGDFVDAVFKANSRNSVLLEEHLRKKGKKNLQKNGQPIPAVDPSDPEEFDRLQRGDPPEYTETQPSRHANMSASRGGDGHRPQSTGVADAPTRPSAAKVRDSRGSGGGFFGFGGSRKSRPVDEEMGGDNNRPARK